MVNNAADPIGEPNDPPEYKYLIAHGKMLSSEFRFEFGGAVLDSRAQDDIPRVISFIAKDDNRKKQIYLVGFTDNVGDPSKNLSLSVVRCNTVKAALELHGLKVNKVIGLGSARPIRGNDTEEGRDETRRVEVWVID